MGKVIELTNDAYLLDTGQGIPVFCENNAHLWTIQDAKDGDVLAFSNDIVVIFKDLYNSSTFHSYCYIEDGIFNNNKDELPSWWEGKGFHPATKEQRELLFQKMKETGYEWDAEKKELRKMEQKSDDRLDPLIDEEIDLWIKENSDIHHDNNDIVKLMRDMACYVATLTRNLYRQKSKWTEDDNLMIDSIIDTIERLEGKGATSMKDWLKSLKQRMKE